MMMLRQMKASLERLFTPLEDLSSSPQQLRRMLLIPRTPHDDVSSKELQYQKIDIFLMGTVGMWLYRG